PSVVFGPEDHFFNQFAHLATFLPALPAIGGGKTRFQPVYAGDVARAIAACVENPAAAGKIFELGGPEVFTFRQILEFIYRTLGRTPRLVPLPFPLASFLAAFMEALPRPPLTRDQIRLLQYDNVVDPHALTFATLGIEPQAVRSLVPDYLARFGAAPAIALSRDYA
ncbi:MAG: complex I NDUFA9 subunit family protein, partial [Alphaproteobacteria bacterium]|nr:complex I NDUFA9 subunit family protein [Alphaproteobacteria bacterium]